MYLFKTYLSIFSILKKKDKSNFIKIQFIIIFSSILEALGILSIIPYVVFLEKLDTLKSNNFDYEIVNFIFDSFSRQEIVIYSSLITFLIFVFANLVIIFSNKHYINFSKNLQQSVAERLITFYLSKDLDFFNKKKINSILFNVLSGASRSVTSVIYPCIQIFSKFLVASIIIIVLAITSLNTTVVVLIVFGFLFISFVKFYNKQIKNISSKLYEFSKKRQESAKQAIDFYFDTIFFGKNFIIKNFLKNNFKYLEITSKNEFISFLPKYVLEIFAFGSIALIVPTLIFLENDLSTIMPILILYVVSGYKLMPTVQAIYGSAILIKTNLQLYNNVKKDLELEKTIQKKIILDEINSVKIKKLSFGFSPKKMILNNINLIIKKGDIIGFTGRSGIGKSTLGLIICGLINKYNGKIFINETIKPSDFDIFKSSISYLNSNVNIFNLSFKENIFFSEKKQFKNKLNNILKMSYLDDFYNKDLKKASNLILSQDKINLSTGQKQRVGISRVLSKNADLIILDEATNGLDISTEDKVLKELKKVSKDKIVIIITHKKRTLKICNSIYKLENKKLKLIK